MPWREEEGKYQKISKRIQGKKAKKTYFVVIYGQWGSSSDPGKRKRIEALGRSWEIVPSEDSNKTREFGEEQRGVLMGKTRKLWERKKNLRDHALWCAFWECSAPGKGSGGNRNGKKKRGHRVSSSQGGTMGFVGKDEVVTWP